jgi:hypothetical protein
MFIPKDQAKDVIDKLSAQTGDTPDVVIQNLIKNGHTLEGLNDKPAPTTAITTPSAPQGVGDRVIEGVKGAAKTAIEGVKAGGEGVAKVAEATGLTDYLAGKMLPEGQKLRPEVQNQGTFGERAADVAAGVTQAAAAPLHATYGAIWSGIAEAVPEVGQVIQGIVGKENIQSLSDTASQGYKMLENAVGADRAKAMAQGVQGLVDTLGIKAGKAAAPVVAETVAKGAERVSGVTSELAGKAAAGLEQKALAQTAEQTAKGVSELLTPKPISELTTTQATKAIGKAGKITESGFLRPATIAKVDPKVTAAINEVQKIPNIQHGDPITAHNQIIDAQSSVVKNLEDTLSKIPVQVNNAVAGQQFRKYISAAVKNDPAFADPIAANSAKKLANVIANKMEIGGVETAKDMWDLRKFADQTMLKGKNYATLGDNQKVALDLVRNMINDSTEKLAPGTKDLFRSWHNLENAKGLVAPKAAEHLNSTLNNAFQKVKKVLDLKTSAAIGVGTYAAGATGLAGAVAPFAAVGGAAAGIGYGLYRGGQALMSPTAKTLFAKALRKLESITKSGDAAKAAQAAKDIEVINSAISAIKSQKGFINPQAIGEDLGILKKSEAGSILKKSEFWNEKYGNFDASTEKAKEFLQSHGLTVNGHGKDTGIESLNGFYQDVSGYKSRNLDYAKSYSGYEADKGSIRFIEPQGEKEIRFKNEEFKKIQELLDDYDSYPETQKIRMKVANGELDMATARKQYKTERKNSSTITDQKLKEEKAEASTIYNFDKFFSDKERLEEAKNNWKRFKNIDEKRKILEKMGKTEAGISEKSISEWKNTK